MITFDEILVEKDLKKYLKEIGNLENLKREIKRKLKKTDYKYITVYIKNTEIKFEENQREFQGFSKNEIWFSFKKTKNFDEQYYNFLYMFNQFRYRFLFHHSDEIENDLRTNGIKVSKLKTDILKQIIYERELGLPYVTLHVKKGKYYFEETGTFYQSFNKTDVIFSFPKYPIKKFFDEYYLNINYNEMSQTFSDKEGDNLTFDDLRNLVIDYYDIEDIPEICEYYQKFLKLFDEYRLKFLSKSES
jgi:hypothetical protein